MGNQVFQLVATQTEPLVVEDQIKKEYQEKLTERLKKIGEQIQTRFTEISSMVSSYKDEYERKEKILTDKLSKASPMPDVTWEHAERGLSVVKGNEVGKLIWLVKRIYNPITVDRLPIEPAYIKKLRADIFVAITTKDNKVVGICSREMSGLRYHDHYHQSNPDCLGSWSYNKEWKTPEDLLKLADDFCAVMSNVNTMSIAHRAPRGLPTLNTLRRHVLPNAQPINVVEPVRTTQDNVTFPENDTW
jgi:hypothetical protein